MFFWIWEDTAHFEYYCNFIYLIRFLYTYGFRGFAFFVYLVKYFMAVYPSQPITEYQRWGYAQHYVYVFPFLIVFILNLCIYRYLINCCISVNGRIIVSFLYKKTQIRRMDTVYEKPTRKEKIWNFLLSSCLSGC